MRKTSLVGLPAGIEIFVHQIDVSQINWINYRQIVDFCWKCVFVKFELLILSSVFFKTKNFSEGPSFELYVRLMSNDWQINEYIKPCPKRVMSQTQSSLFSSLKTVQTFVVALEFSDCFYYFVRCDCNLVGKDLPFKMLILLIITDSVKLPGSKMKSFQSNAFV